MAASERLQLEITVESGKATASIKGVNEGLASVGKTGATAGASASGGMDQMTASISKGILAAGGLAAAIVGAVKAIKALTIESAFAAAANEKAYVVLGQLAKANDIRAESAMDAVKAVKALGYQDTEAIGLINRLIYAELNLADATKIAAFAKDAAAQGNITRQEALANIMFAVESGSTRRLRTMGIMVDMEKRLGIEEAKLNRTLTEHERVQKTLNAVLSEHPKIMGTAAAVTGTAADQNRDLAFTWQEAKEELGKHFLPLMKQLIDAMKQGAQWVKDYSQTIASLTTSVISLGAVLVAYKIPAQLIAISTALKSITVAALANPFGLIAAGAVSFGLILRNQYQQIKEFDDRMGDVIKKAEILRQIKAGKTLDELKQLGYTADQVKAAFAGMKGEIEAIKQFDLELPKLKAVAPEITAEQIRARRAAETFASDYLLKAQEKEFGGLHKILLERDRLLKQHGLTLKAISDINAATEIGIKKELQKIRLEQRKELEPIAKAAEEQQRNDQKYRDARWQAEREFSDETTQLHIDTINQQFEYEGQVLRQSHDERLRQLEMTGTRTLEQKLALEQAKGEIEQQYTERSYQLKLAQLKRETRAELDELEFRAQVGLVTLSQHLSRRGAILDAMRERERQMEISLAADIGAARENAAIRQGDLIRDHNQKVFDSIKRSAEGVFDALLMRGSSVFQALANTFKTAILTAIKEIVTSHIARMLMQLLAGRGYGVAGATAGAGGGGGLLRTLGLAGMAAPAVAGGTGGTTASTSAASMFMPGGVSGWGALGLTMGGLALAGRPGLSRIAGMGMMGGGLGMMAGRAGFGPLGAQAGIGLGMAAYGLQRGGKVGLGLSTAGGMLAGAAIGTMILPGIGTAIGAAIGATAGAIAGIIRLVVKGATEKTRQKIKATYGIDIQDRGLLKQIVEMARQSFGGNVDMAIRSQQIRDLIQLYALSTGQTATGMPAVMRPVSIVQAGGGLYQAPTYSAGTSALERISGMGVAAAPTIINITVPGAQEFFRNETVRVVVDNPRAVQSATMAATRSNAGRREMTALSLSPGLLTS